MRFDKQQHRFYGGIDLHARSMFTHPGAPGGIGFQAEGLGEISPGQAKRRPGMRTSTVLHAVGVQEGLKIPAHLRRAKNRHPIPRAALRLPWADFPQAFGLKTRIVDSRPRAALRLPWADFPQAFGLKTAMMQLSLENKVRPKDRTHPTALHRMSDLICSDWPPRRGPVNPVYRVASPLQRLARRASAPSGS